MQKAISVQSIILRAQGFCALPIDRGRLALIEHGRIAALPGRCVQCGLCEYNCPVGIPVRRYSRVGSAIDDPACLKCGSCVARCPRHTLYYDLVG